MAGRRGFGGRLSRDPDITVVIPTRDRAEFLPLAVQTATEQESVDVAVVVVDDRSKVPAAGLSRLGDPRVRIVRLSTKSGVPAARNAGLAATQTEWVAFLDDDDVWAPTKLRQQLDAAENENAEWVYCAAVMFDERRGIMSVLPAPP